MDARPCRYEGEDPGDASLCRGERRPFGVLDPAISPKRWAALEKNEEVDAGEAASDRTGGGGGGDGGSGDGGRGCCCGRLPFTPDPVGTGAGVVAGGRDGFGGAGLSLRAEEAGIGGDDPARGDVAEEAAAGEGAPLRSSRASRMRAIAGGGGGEASRCAELEAIGEAAALGAGDARERGEVVLPLPSLVVRFGVDAPAFFCA